MMMDVIDKCIRDQLDGNVPFGQTNTSPGKQKDKADDQICDVIDVEFQDPEEPVHDHRSFPYKLWEAVQCDSSDLLQWSEDGKIVLVNADVFEEEVMTTYPVLVRIPTLLNFRRQLREYGFLWHKETSICGRCQFSHPQFLKGEYDLLLNLKTRRKSKMLAQDKVGDTATGTTKGTPTLDAPPASKKRKRKSRSKVISQTNTEPEDSVQNQHSMTGNNNYYLLERPAVCNLRTAVASVQTVDLSVLENQASPYKSVITHDVQVPLSGAAVSAITASNAVIVVEPDNQVSNQMQAQNKLQISGITPISGGSLTSQGHDNTNYMYNYMSSGGSGDPGSLTPVNRQTPNQDPPRTNILTSLSGVNLGQTQNYQMNNRPWIGQTNMTQPTYNAGLQQLLFSHNQHNDNIGTFCGGHSQNTMSGGFMQTTMNPGPSNWSGYQPINNLPTPFPPCFPSLPTAPTPRSSLSATRMSSNVTSNTQPLCNTNFETPINRSASVDPASSLYNPNYIPVMYAWLPTSSQTTINSLSKSSCELDQSNIPPTLEGEESSNNSSQVQVENISEDTQTEAPDTDEV